MVALVGDNGAGKSTLVKVLAGVHQPTEGDIHYGDERVTIDSPARALSLGIATVFQDVALCENLDVVANVFLGHELEPWRLDEIAMEVRAWTLLRELAARILSVREPIASLSGGQRQTVAIARSTHGTADVDACVCMTDIEPTRELEYARQHAGHLCGGEQVDGERQRAVIEFRAELAQTVGRAVEHHHAATSRQEMTRAFETDPGRRTRGPAHDRAGVW